MSSRGSLSCSISGGLPKHRRGCPNLARRHAFGPRLSIPASSTPFLHWMAWAVGTMIAVIKLLTPNLAASVLGDTSPPHMPKHWLMKQGENDSAYRIKPTIALLKLVSLPAQSGVPAHVNGGPDSSSTPSTQATRTLPVLRGGL